MYGYQCVARIVLAREHVTELDCRDLLFYGIESRVDAFCKGFIIQFLGNCQFFFEFGAFAFNLAESFRPDLVLAYFSKYLLCFLLVVPEVLFGGYLLELPCFLQTFINVKDTPVTVLCAGGFRAGVLSLLQTLFFSGL